MRKAIPAILLLSAAIACGPNEAPSPQSGTAPGAETPAGSPAPAAAPAAPNAPVAAPGGTAPGAAPGESKPATPSQSSPQAPPVMAIDVPPGTELTLTLETGVSSETAKPEQIVRATVAKPVIVGDMVAIPEGALVTGTVVSSVRSGRVKGVASIAIRFNEVTVGKTPYRINTSRIAREAEATKGEDARKIAIGTGVGTAIGAIAGGKKGAAIGAGIGGGAGTGAVLATRGEEATIPAGATLKTTIQDAVTITK